MRNTREILRQKWLLERPHRAVCASVGVSMGAVSQALKRAAGAKLTWCCRAHWLEGASPDWMMVWRDARRSA